MAMLLRLDKKALMHLLEDNEEEVKLELTTAVVAEAGRAFGLKVSAICKTYIDQQYGQVLHKVVQDEFANTNWSKRTTSLKNDFVEEIKREVRAQVADIIQEEIGKVDLDVVTQEATDRLVRYTEARTDDRIRKMLDDVVTASIIAAMKEAA